jgi:hypothetical protein
MHRNALFLLLLLPQLLVGQVNRKGTWHLAIGASLGAHNTQYISTSTVSVPILGGTYQVRTEENDGAATVLFPIDVQYGLARPVSVGLFVEPGAYLDSNNTRTNSLVLFGFQPRAYIINHDRFCWSASLQIGSGSLRINDTEGGVDNEARYAGPLFGLGSGVGFYFGEHIGLRTDLRYLGSALRIKDYSENGQAVDLSAFEAELNTTGFTLQVALALRF